ncbi:hypothetical protein FNF29_07991 [Cafeteria roenbergensis]|uniref:PPM-type phosphatase domain-containing protein n=1 Tax=Cafeteria roenbergensis TaxID=33653 RepID=A0A5A8C1U9_CAFRO|nr:hypothetical protein FNF29_07991 [Cafeteria roenbergensis]|eukprot:KAA0146519.1 hypothetical protein FNF29_07991 [Cafeteria roenbergensis]
MEGPGTALLLLDWLASVPGHVWMAALTLVVVLVLYRCATTDSVHPRRQQQVLNALLPYGIDFHIGQRPYMEDRHVVAGEVGGDACQSFYGVFDGHGGWRAAEYCQLHLSTQVEEMLVRDPEPSKALVAAFEQTDREFLRCANGRQLPWEDGTTAVAALVRGSDIWVANAGDSRAVLVRTDGSVRPLSLDHKPNRPDERDRILSTGGSVIHHGVWRVQGMLAVSRALGDRALKPWVPPTPEICRHTIDEADAFLVLATDGLWDVMSNEEVGGAIYAVAAPQTVAERLVREALSRGSSDNVTALVVDLRAASARVALARTASRSSKSPVLEPGLPSAHANADGSAIARRAVAAASTGDAPAVGRRGYAHA